jgi:rfaE bifunctional protein kinase chain/domain
LKTGLSEILNEFSNYTVMVIGDVMVDSYLWGSVTRISPEAPVPIVSCTKTDNRLGGAANVAENIRSLGAIPVICSVIGKDEQGQIFKDILKVQGMDGGGLVETDERQTTIKTRIISNNQQLLRIDQEIEGYLSEELEHMLTDRILEVVNSRKINAIIFQDYDKGVITPGLIERVISYANEKGIPTFVDPKKRNFSIYKNATLFKPNFKELTAGLNIDIEKKDFNSVFNAAKLLHKSGAFELVLITLSELGILISDGKNYHVVPAMIRDVADVSGAGDTVIATAALAFLSGLSPKQIAALANLAGGIVCERAGVFPIEKELLLKDNFILPED